MIRCEICGCERLVKDRDGLFACPNCGACYTTESLKEMVGTDTRASLPLEFGQHPETADDILASLFDNGEYEAAYEHCEMLKRAHAGDKEFLPLHPDVSYYSCLCDAIIESSHDLIVQAVADYMRRLVMDKEGSEAISLAVSHCMPAIKLCLGHSNIHIAKAREEGFKSSRGNDHDHDGAFLEHRDQARLFLDAIRQVCILTLHAVSVIIAKGYVLKAGEDGVIQDIIGLLNDSEKRLPAIQAALDQIRASILAESADDVRILRTANDDVRALFAEARSLWRKGEYCPSVYAFSLLEPSMHNYPEIALYTETFEVTETAICSPTQFKADLGSLLGNLRTYALYETWAEEGTDIEGYLAPLEDVLNKLRETAGYIDNEVALSERESADAGELIERRELIAEAIAVTANLPLKILEDLIKHGVLHSPTDLRMIKSKAEAADPDLTGDSIAGIKQACFNLFKQYEQVSRLLEAHGQGVDDQISEVDASIGDKTKERDQLGFFATKQKRLLDREIEGLKEKKAILERQRNDQLAILENIWSKL